jgi:hypothetical protein
MAFVHPLGWDLVSTDGSRHARASFAAACWRLSYLLAALMFGYIAAETAVAEVHPNA